MLVWIDMFGKDKKPVLAFSNTEFYGVVNFSGNISLILHKDFLIMWSLRNGLPIGFCPKIQAHRTIQENLLIQHYNLAIKKALDSKKPIRS